MLMSCKINKEHVSGIVCMYAGLFCPHFYIIRRLIKVLFFYISVVILISVVLSKCLLMVINTTVA